MRRPRRHKCSVAARCALVLVNVQAIGCGISEPRSGPTSALERHKDTPTKLPSEDEVAVPRLPRGPFVDVTVGREHACALRADGSASCFGADPVAELELISGRWKDLEADSHTTCGVRLNGSIECFGAAWPAHWIPSGSDFRSLSVAGISVCGISEEGAVRCGRSLTVDQPAEDKKVRSINVSELSGACAILELTGELYCWQHQRKEAPPSEAILSVSVGYFHGCAIAANGSLSCWGTRATRGVSRAYTAMWQPPMEDRSYVSVAGSDTSHCAQDAEGMVHCWGSQKLSRGGPRGPFVAYDSHTYTACGITGSGELDCWGLVNDWIPANGG